jgi:hypothetical protein
VLVVRIAGLVFGHVTSVVTGARLFFVFHTAVLEPARILATNDHTYHILICRSVSCNDLLISLRRFRVRYRLKWNSFSNSSV